MASSRSFAEEEQVDPQLQKSSPEESAGNAAEMATVTKKKKKKIMLQHPDWYVKDVLSYKPDTTVMEVPECIIKNDPRLAATLYLLFASNAMYDECMKEQKLEEQRNFREQLRTQGRVTYEIEVDDDGETAVGSSRGRGRRRHRPGVMKKQDGQTRKIN
ncbi:unnamed protein product [Alopecurus aequalis]